MRFADIPGLQETKRALQRAIAAEHAAHAQLFWGKEGALALPIALAYAQYLHCEQPAEDACGACPACLKNAKYIHPDTQFIFPYSNVNQTKNEQALRSNLLKDWRSFLTEKPFGSPEDWISFYSGDDKQPIISREEIAEMTRMATLKPFESARKAIVIWQPEKMGQNAANAILKILEEPPPDTFFLLASNAAEQLLPTILSRAQGVRVPMLADEALEEYLKKTRQTPDAQCRQIARLAEGNLRAAEQLLEETKDYFEYFFEWLLGCYKGDYAALVGYANDFHDLSILEQQNILRYAMLVLRDTMLSIAQAEDLIRLDEQQKGRVQKLARQMSMRRIEKCYRHFNQTAYHLQRNASAKMSFLDLSLQVTMIFRS